MSEARDKALHTVVKLRALINHPTTPPNEAEAARSRLKVLCEKYDINESEKPPTTPKEPPQGNRSQYEWFMGLVRNQEMARRRAEAERQRREDIKNKDDLGQPKTDPFADSRTRAERQRDINNSWGKNTAWFNDTFHFQKSPQPMNDQDWVKSHKVTRCDPKLEFYDRGGIARRRNTRLEKCANCGTDLYVGDGAEIPMIQDNLVSLAWGCCDKVPGPRVKKSAQSE